MKISEVQHILNNLIKEEGDIEVLGISVIRANITVCYKKQGEIKSYSCEYKNCDLD